MSGLIDKYLEYVRVERRLADRTVALYAIHLKALAGKAQAAGVALDQVQTAHVRRWMAELHGAGREPRGDIACRRDGVPGHHDRHDREARVLAQQFERGGADGAAANKSDTYGHSSRPAHLAAPLRAGS